MDRARTFLAPVLSLEEFHRLEQHPAALAELPVTIAHALETANWSLVKELSQRAQPLKRPLDDKAAPLQAGAERVRRPGRSARPVLARSPIVHADPGAGLATLRTRALELLGTLERADGPWKDFYAARRRAFQARPQTASDMFEPDAATSSPTDALEAARQALKAGDMNRLAALADALSAAGSQSGSSSSHAANAGSAPAAGEPGQDLQPVAYSSETLARARHLGLTPRHLEPRMELASLRQYAWTPLSDERGHSGAAQLRLPSGTPEALRDGLAVFMIHPLVNSGGARYLPSLVAEDVLVEDFPDPVDGQTPPASELVKSLGLSGAPRRCRASSSSRRCSCTAPAFSRTSSDSIRTSSVWCASPRTSTSGSARRRAGDDSHSGLTSMATSSGRSTARLGYRPSPAATSATAGSTICSRSAASYDSDHLLARFAVVQRARMVAW